MLVITVARKPLEGSVASNTIKWGCGSMNIDGTRVSAPNEVIATNSKSDGASKGKGIYGQWGGLPSYQTEGQKLGRWPANVILTPATAEALDEQSGIVPTGTWNRQKDTAHPFGNAKDTPYETWREAPKEAPGGASRFFKVVKC